VAMLGEKRYSLMDIGCIEGIRYTEKAVPPCTYRKDPNLRNEQNWAKFYIGSK
jgi:hypothetical protein